jgi:hypothetical protein
MRAAIRDYSRLPLRIDPESAALDRPATRKSARETCDPGTMCATSLVRGEIEANAERHYAATQTRLGDRIEIDHKSRVDGASRNEIANLPIREFAAWKHLPHGDGHLEDRNARIVNVIDQVADNRLPNIQ